MTSILNGRLWNQHVFLKIQNRNSLESYTQLLDKMYATRQCALSKIKLQKSPNDSSTGLLKYCQPIPFQYCSTNKIENKATCI